MEIRKEMQQPFAMFNGNNMYVFKNTFIAKLPRGLREKLNSSKNSARISVLILSTTKAESEITQHISKSCIQVMRKI